MLDQILKFATWILGLWNGLPQPIKDKIIELATECFDQIFREYYRRTKGK